jgi:hypothetical protein
MPQSELDDMGKRLHDVAMSLCWSLAKAARERAGRDEPRVEQLAGVLASYAEETYGARHLLEMSGDLDLGLAGLLEALHPELEGDLDDTLQVGLGSAGAGAGAGAGWGQRPGHGPRRRAHGPGAAAQGLVGARGTSSPAQARSLWRCWPVQASRAAAPAAARRSPAANPLATPSARPRPAHTPAQRAHPRLPATPAQEDLQALLVLAFQLLSHVANVHELVEGEAVEGPNPFASRGQQVAVAPRALPRKAWAALCSEPLVNWVITQGTLGARSKEMWHLVHLLAWNNEAVLQPMVRAGLCPPPPRPPLRLRSQPRPARAPAALGITATPPAPRARPTARPPALAPAQASALCHLIYHTNQTDLTELENVLDGLYISHCDELAEERLRTLLDGQQGDEEPEGGERQTLLWQVKSCFRKAQHWHVLWRLRHIGRMVANSPLGLELLAWLRSLVMESASRGQLYPEWHEVFAWVLQQQNSGANRELAAMAADVVRDLLQPLLGTGRGG